MAADRGAAGADGGGSDLGRRRGGADPTLEGQVSEQRLVAERLARLEEQGVATRQAVERIERKLEAVR